MVLQNSTQIGKAEASTVCCSPQRAAKPILVQLITQSTDHFAVAYIIHDFVRKNHPFRPPLPQYRLILSSIYTANQSKTVTPRSDLVRQDCDLENE